MPKAIKCPGPVSIFDEIDPKIVEEIETLMIDSGFSRRRLAEVIKERYNIDVSVSQLRRREKTVWQRMKAQESPFEAELGVASKGRQPTQNTMTLRGILQRSRVADEQVMQTRKSLGDLEDKLVSLIDLNLDQIEDREQRKLLKKMREDVCSNIRFAKELFAEVPYFAYLNYAIHLLQLRISKRHEMELRLGVVMRDTSEDTERLVRIIKEAIQIQQSLGIAPKVDKPINVNNIQTNMFLGNNPVDFQQHMAEINELRAIYRQIQYDTEPDPEGSDPDPGQ